MSRKIGRKSGRFRLALAAAVLTTGAIVIGTRQALPLATDPVETALRTGWQVSTGVAGAWYQQDATQRVCTKFADLPPDAEAVAIMEREWRAIVYPADGEVSGEWVRGAALARPAGAVTPVAAPVATGNPVKSGQCLACHRLEPGDPVDTRAGPDLSGYGRQRGNLPAQQRLIYEQIFNSNALNACSAMPRFGVHKVLSPNEIRDIVAYLLSPQSPVNSGAGQAQN